MRRNLRPILLMFGGVLVLGLMTLLIINTGSPTPAPVPNPNGYDDFVRAATLVTGDVYGEHSEPGLVSLRALVATNSESLRLVRLGLSRQCALPADSVMTNVAGMMTDLARLKRLATLIVAEGRLAEMENRFSDAAQSYMDAIYFGNETSRGGFVINRLVGMSCEALGETPLSKLAPRLDDEAARRVIAQLEKLDQVGVTWEEVRRSERRFEYYQLRKGFNPLVWVTSRWQNWTSMRRAEMRNKGIAAHLRLLTTELALRCYRIEHGHVPTTLSQLVPKNLRLVPIDPFSEKPMIYRPLGTNWVLYSIGEDGLDNGGKPVARSSIGTVAKGDIFYDSPY